MYLEALFGKRNVPILWNQIVESPIHPDLKLYYNLRTYCISKSKLISVVVAHFCESFFIECNSIRVTFICRSVAVIKGNEEVCTKTTNVSRKITLPLFKSGSFLAIFYTANENTNNSINIQYVFLVLTSLLSTVLYSVIRFQKSTRGKELSYRFHSFLKV